MDAAVPAVIFDIAAFTAGKVHVLSAPFFVIPLKLCGHAEETEMLFFTGLTGNEICMQYIV